MNADERKSVKKLFLRLNPLIKLDSESKKLIRDHIEIVQLKPKEIFIAEGNVVNKIGFLVIGILRSYLYDEKGMEMTSLFLKEQDFVTNINSFFNKVPSSETMETETKCELIIIQRSAWELFCEKIPYWQEVMTKVSNDYLLAKTSFQRSLLNLESTDRYHKFSEDFPTVVYKVPLGHIATFLGINQSTLSRIRGNKKK